MPNPSPVVERVFDYTSEVRKGKLDLSWIESNRWGWGVKATPRDAGGLGLEDLNRVGTYGDVPDRGSSYGSMAPRGSEIPPDVPSLGYDINDKSLVWADNVALLYDEAIAYGRIDRGRGANRQ
jgi:hypothetical protein